MRVPHLEKGFGRGVHVGNRAIIRNGQKRCWQGRQELRRVRRRAAFGRRGGGLHVRHSHELSAEKDHAASRTGSYSKRPQSSRSASAGLSLVTSGRAKAAPGGGPSRAAPSAGAGK